MFEKNTLSRREMLSLLGSAAVLPLASAWSPVSLRDPLIHSSASSLANAIRTKQVSSVEVVRAYLDRIEEVNTKLNAVVQLVPDRALDEARRADADLARGEIRGPLHGVPMTLKDSLDTTGVISTAGTSGRRNYVPPSDATVVARMRDAGAILLGKTNTPEFTHWGETDNLVYGKTSNPYDLSRSPGGSSGGAAAIVAAAGSPLDLGSDTGGSIRWPSHFCGIAGLKPTNGRVPRTGHFISFDAGLASYETTIGPIARYVEDLILALPIISGADGQDPDVIPVPLPDPAAIDLRQLRAAYYQEDGVLSSFPPTPATKVAVTRAVESLSGKGVKVEERRPEALDRLRDLSGYSDGGASLARSIEKAGTERLSPPIQLQVEGGRNSTLSLREAGEKLIARQKFRGEMLRFMEHYDLIVCPVAPFPAFLHGALDEMVARSLSVDGFVPDTYTSVFNITGWPAAVVRAGTSPEGLPIGVQVVGRPWREDTVLATAQFLEKELGGWQPPPI